MVVAHVFMNFQMEVLIFSAVIWIRQQIVGIDALKKPLHLDEMYNESRTFFALDHYAEFNS